MTTILYATLLPRKFGTLNEDTILENFIRDYQSRPKGKHRILLLFGSAHQSALDKAKQIMDQHGPNMKVTYYHIPFEYTPIMSERRGHEISHCKKMISQQAKKRIDYEYLLFRDSDVEFSYEDICSAIHILSPRNKTKTIVNIPYLLRTVNLKHKVQMDNKNVPSELLGCYMHHRQLFKAYDYCAVIYPTKTGANGKFIRVGAPDSNIASFLKKRGVQNIRHRKCTTRHYTSRKSYNVYENGFVYSVRKDSTEIIIGMACTKNRLGNLKKSVPILLNQCNGMYIHLNGFEGKVPDFLKHSAITVTMSKANKGDTMKFVGVKHAKGYFFSVDDDILYPKDYIKTMIQSLHRRMNNCVMCVHGSTFDPYGRIKGFINSRKMYDFRAALDKDTKVMMPGTGTVGFHVSKFVPNLKKFTTANMADIWVMIQAAGNDMGCISIQRPKGWLKQLNTGGESIQYKRPVREMEQAVATYLRILKKAHNELK